MSEVATTPTHQAARASWLAPVIAFCFVAFSRNIPNRTPVTSLIIGGVAYLFYVAGLFAAIYALATMRRVGKRGVLIPAIIGFVLSGTLVLIFSALIFRILA